MGQLKLFFVSGAALAVSSALAPAADMPGNLPPPRFEARPALIDLQTGWYMRGDIGALMGKVDGATAPPGFLSPTDNKLGKGMSGGYGFGIKGSWLRTDLTVDYLSPLNYQGTVASPGDTTAKIQTTAGLFNGYLDLGTWYRATPYIGAGAGAGYVRLSDYASPNPPFGNTDRTQWRFAWAALAGIAVPISHNMQVDVGYRYLNIGDVMTAKDNFGATTFKNIASHEVRVGVRWNFDELRYAR